MEHPDWMWDEKRQIGTDFADVAEVARYDARMAEFRDVETENRNLLGILALPKGSCVLEIGCGTGRFARHAAREGMKVTALDISPAMAAYVREKASGEGLRDVTVRQEGFLTMDLPEGSFDAAVTGAALHHLPDAWKLVALRNIARVLRKDGQLLLGDVVFALSGGEPPEKAFARFADSFQGMRKEAARHVATEYSTYDWVMEGLLERAGFKPRLVARPSEGFALYHAVKR